MGTDAVGQERPAGSKRVTPYGSLSVVVCIHDALPWVKKCIRALQQSKPRPTELILVDDGSEPACAQYVLRQELLHENVTCLRFEDRVWYSAAANAGVALAQYPTIALVNSDAIVGPSALSDMQWLLLDPSVALVGPVSNAAGYQSLPWNDAASGPFPVCGLPSGTSAEALAGYWREACTQIATDLPILNGFLLMFRRSEFLESGGFDIDRFPYGYGEELDLCMRLRSAGASLMVRPDTYVFHGKTQSYQPAERRLFVSHARAALVDKHGADQIERARRDSRASLVLRDSRSEMRRLYAWLDGQHR